MLSKSSELSSISISIEFFLEENSTIQQIITYIYVQKIQ